MKIALTGGPSAGKTSVVEILARSEYPRLVIVQEAAALLFRGGFPRTTKVATAECQQIAVYHVQKQLERVMQLEHPHAAIICDRGSLDALAYWPGTAESFFQSVGSSMSEEISRYDYVIHLDTAGADQYKKSRIRIEDYNEAERLNERVKQAWALHPNRLIIPATDDFLSKIQKAVESVRAILDRRS